MIVRGNRVGSSRRGASVAGGVALALLLLAIAVLLAGPARAAGARTGGLEAPGSVAGAPWSVSELDEYCAAVAFDYAWEFEHASNRSDDECQIVDESSLVRFKIASDDIWGRIDRLASSCVTYSQPDIGQRSVACTLGSTLLVATVESGFFIQYQEPDGRDRDRAEQVVVHAVDVIDATFGASTTTASTGGGDAGGGFGWMRAATVAISILSVALSLAGARRAVKLRPVFDVVRLVVSVAVVGAVAAITGVTTPPILLVVAVIAGGFLGHTVGGRLDVWEESGRIWLRRAGLGVALWGASVVAMQLAGYANRSGIVSLGQSLAVFGAASQAGTLMGRDSAVRVARATAGAVAAVVVLAAVVVGPAALTAPRPADAAVPASGSPIAPDQADVDALIAAVCNRLGYYTSGNWCADLGYVEVEIGTPARFYHVNSEGYDVDYADRGRAYDGTHIRDAWGYFERCGLAVYIATYPSSGFSQAILDKANEIDPIVVQECNKLRSTGTTAPRVVTTTTRPRSTTSSPPATTPRTTTSTTTTTLFDPASAPTTRVGAGSGSGTGAGAPSGSDDERASGSPVASGSGTDVDIDDEDADAAGVAGAAGAAAVAATSLTELIGSRSGRGRGDGGPGGGAADPDDPREPDLPPPPPTDGFVDYDGSRHDVNDGSVEGVPIGWVRYPTGSGDHEWMSPEDAAYERDRWARLTADADRARAESNAAHDARARAARAEHLGGLYRDAALLEQRRQRAEALEEMRRQRILRGARGVAAEQSSAWRHALREATLQGDHDAVEALYREALEVSWTESNASSAMWNAEANREAWGEFVAQRTVDASKAGLMAVGGPAGFGATATGMASIGAAGGMSEGYHQGEDAAKIAMRGVVGAADGAKDAALSRLEGMGFGRRARAAAGFAGDGASAFVQAKVNGASNADAAYSGFVAGTVSAAGEVASDAIDGVDSNTIRVASSVGSSSVQAGSQAAAMDQSGDPVGAFVNGMKEGFWGAMAGQAGGSAGSRAAEGASMPKVSTSRVEWGVDGTVTGRAAAPGVAAGQEGVYTGSGYAVGADRTPEAAAIGRGLGASGRGEVYGPDGRRVLTVLPDGRVVDGQNRVIDPTTIQTGPGGKIIGYSEPSGSAIDLTAPGGPTRTVDTPEGPKTEPADLVTGRGRPPLDPGTEATFRALGAGPSEQFVDPDTGRTMHRAPIYGQDGRVIGHVDSDGRMTNVHGAKISKVDIENGRITVFETEDGSTFETAAPGARARDVPVGEGETANRGAELSSDDFLRGMEPGSEIPKDALHQTGAPDTHHRALHEAAKQGYTTPDGEQRAVRIGQRTTIQEALNKIITGKSTEKPLPIKAKTIKLEDTFLAPGLKVSDIGDVAFLRPDQIRSPEQIRTAIEALGLPPDKSRALLLQTLEQRSSRLREHANLSATMDGLRASGYADVDANGKVVSGANYERSDVAPGTPFAGDVDGVYIVDAETGKPVTHEQARQVIGNIKAQSSGTQHGFEGYAGDDVAQAAGARPTDADYQAQRRAAAEKLAFLERNQRSGSEVNWEMGPDGVARRGANLNSLSTDQVVGGPRFTPTVRTIDELATPVSTRLAASDLANIARGGQQWEEER